MIAGIDEAGRGALAGPVISALVILNDKSIEPAIFEDSKSLTRKKRKCLYQTLRKSNCTILFSIINNKEIDKINILNATLKSMKHCIVNLKDHVEKIIIDGNKRPFIKNSPNIETCIGGDKLVPEISAASIIAKEIRDKIMEKYEYYLPEYSFKVHKGYGTKQHYNEISQYGITKIHRESFNLNKQLSLFC